MFMDKFIFSDRVEIRNVDIDGEIPKASNSKFFKNHFFIEINT